MEIGSWATFRFAELRIYFGTCSFRFNLQEKLTMHTYEVLVDVKESIGLLNNDFRSGTSRYEIDAESRKMADGMARLQARNEHPNGIEYDVRVTRLLR